MSWSHRKPPGNYHRESLPPIDKLSIKIDPKGLIGYFFPQEPKLRYKGRKSVIVRISTSISCSSLPFSSGQGGPVCVSKRHSFRFTPKKTTSELDRLSRHLVVVEGPFAHEADLSRHDTIENKLGIVGRTQIHSQKRIALPDVHQLRRTSGLPAHRHTRWATPG